MGIRYLVIQRKGKCRNEGDPPMLNPPCGVTDEMEKQMHDIVKDDLVNW